MIIDFAKLNNTPGPGPSGAAWGGITGNINNQTDLMNKFGGYTQPSDFKTINSESIVGSGDIVISGGLTPEQEEAIEPLEETSVGVLYTKSIGSQKVDFCQLTGVGQYIGSWIYQVDDDVYFSWAQRLYKFNKDKQGFDYIVFLQTNNWGYFWTDMTGRFYQGNDLMFDLTTGNYTNVSTNALFNTFDNRSNIIKLNNAVYCIDYQQAQKFNESTQEFESYPITLPSGFMDGVSVVSHIRKYDGRWISVYADKMWELLEYEDHLEIVELSTPLFDIQINDSYIEGSRIYSCEGSLFYLYQYDYYRLNSEGHWESINITYNNPAYEGWTVYYGGDIQATSGKYILGGNHPQGLTEVPITNAFSEEQKVTNWYYDGNQIGLVDITSEQKITGSKQFNSIQANAISTSQINPFGNEIVLYGNINNIGAGLVKTNTSLVLLNDKLAATTDKCILNRTELPYGPYKDVVISGGSYVSFECIYTTHTGRVFYAYNSETKEFTGSAWVTRSMMYLESPRYRVLTTANNTFYIDFNSASTYIWDDTNTDWVRICNYDYGWSSTELWSDGTNVRYSGAYKLVENGGTWSWEIDRDYESTFQLGRYFIINNVLYCVSQNESSIYSVDTTQHTYTKLNTNDIVCINSEYIFEFNGQIFYKYNCGSNNIYVIDMTTYTESLTDILITSSDWPLFVYNNVLYGIDISNNYNTYRVYGVEEELPEVPAQDGVYTLQATVSNGEVTYTWVSAVI